MEIIDLNDQSIKITDLDAAIQQANQFTQYKHTDAAFEQLDKELNTYWNDVLEKLLALKTQFSNDHSSP